MTLIFKSVLFLGLILTTFIVSAQPVKQDGGAAHEEILFREHGQPVVLTCARADDPNQGGITTPLAHPDWTKDGKNVNGAPGDRVTRHNRSSGRRLIIKNTTLEDAGTYQCAVDNGFGTELRSIKVTVEAKPSIKTANEVAAKLGEDVKICEATGVPTPKLTITHNAKPLVASNNVVITNDGVVVKNIQPTDHGYYGCEAINELGSEFGETYLSIA